MIVSDNTEVVQKLMRLAKEVGYADVIIAQSQEMFSELLSSSKWFCGLLLIDTATGMTHGPKREYPAETPCITCIRIASASMSRCKIIVMCNAQFTDDGRVCTSVGADDFQSMDFQYINWETCLFEKLQGHLKQEPLSKWQKLYKKMKPPIPVFNLAERVPAKNKPYRRRITSKSR